MYISFPMHIGRTVAFYLVDDVFWQHRDRILMVELCYSHRIDILAVESHIAAEESEFYGRVYVALNHLLFKPTDVPADLSDFDE